MRIPIRQFPTEHTALSVVFFLLQTAVGNGAMNKFGICNQWRRELFESAIFHLSIGKAVMSFLHFWKWREKCLHGVAASKITTHFSYPYGAVNLLCAIGN
jgi:hypothetical protein